jgi:trk system potassium uptake protein TrkH
VSVTPRAAWLGRRVRLAVDLPAALGLVGTLFKYLSIAVLFPTAVAVGYSEPFWPFLASGAIAAAVGVGLERLGGPAERIGMREGYLVIALIWLLAAGLGALPLVISGTVQLDRPVDAYFEAMSGFTTTGASVATNVEQLDRSIALWRQLMQWLGGMGIIVLALAVLPRLRVGGRQLLESELPGPEVDQLAARIKDTARRLWLLYVSLTVAMILVLIVIWGVGLDDRMTPYEAIAHAFGTLPTGGFSTQARSVEPFSDITQWVIAGFMILAGVNYAVTYKAFVRRRPRVVLQDEELRLYVALLAVAASVITIELWAEGIARGEEAVRQGVFQTASIMTTTGFANADFATWPTLTTMALIGLMFVGGSAGSTSGSIKVVRHVLVGKVLHREIAQTVHPELVHPIRLNRVVVEERTLRAITPFVLLYMGLFVAGTSVLAIDAAITGLELSFAEAIAASATTIGNVGPGLGFAGPMGSFEPFSDVSTIVMTVLMWMGRLEVIPVVILLTRHYWRS